MKRIIVLECELEIFGDYTLKNVVTMLQALPIIRGFPSHTLRVVSIDTSETD